MFELLERQATLEEFTDWLSSLVMKCVVKVIIVYHIFHDSIHVFPNKALVTHCVFCHDSHSLEVKFCACGVALTFSHSIECPYRFLPITGKSIYFNVVLFII